MIGIFWTVATMYMGYSILNVVQKTERVYGGGFSDREYRESLPREIDEQDYRES